VACLRRCDLRYAEARVHVRECRLPILVCTRSYTEVQVIRAEPCSSQGWILPLPDKPGVRRWGKGQKIECGYVLREGSLKSFSLGRPEYACFVDHYSAGCGLTLLFVPCQR
jgi:hypothetical protein